MPTAHALQSPTQVWPKQYTVDFLPEDEEEDWHAPIGVLMLRHRADRLKAGLAVAMLFAVLAHRARVTLCMPTPRAGLQGSSPWR